MSMRPEAEILEAIEEEIHAFHTERKRGEVMHAEQSTHAVQALALNWALNNDWYNKDIAEALSARWKFRGDDCCSECDEYLEDLEDGIEPEEEPEPPVARPSGVPVNVWSAEIYGCDPELHDDHDWCEDCYVIREWITGFDSEESARIGAIGSMQRLIWEGSIEASKAWSLLVVHLSEGGDGRMSSHVNWRDLETVKGEANANA